MGKEREGEERGKERGREGVYRGGRKKREGWKRREGTTYMYYTEEEKVWYLPGPIPSAASGSISSPW